MTSYRRAKTPGGVYFFTVNLAERQRSTLVDHVDLLKRMFREEQKAHPFQIDALVILPDHLHAVLTLPDEMLTILTAGDGSKPHSRRLCRTRKTVRRAAEQKAGGVFGNGVSGNTLFEMSRIMRGM